MNRYLYCCYEAENPDFDPNEHIIGVATYPETPFIVDGIVYDPSDRNTVSHIRPMIDLLDH